MTSTLVCPKHAVDAVQVACQDSALPGGNSCSPPTSRQTQAQIRHRWEEFCKVTVLELKCQLHTSRCPGHELGINPQPTSSPSKAGERGACEGTPQWRTAHRGP